MDKKLAEKVVPYIESCNPDTDSDRAALNILLEELYERIGTDPEFRFSY